MSKLTILYHLRIQINCLWLLLQSEEQNDSSFLFFISFAVVTKLNKCPLGTQPCDRNSGEPGPACPPVACRRR